MSKNLSNNDQRTYDHSKDVTLRIKEDQLEIAKKLIETGEVRIYRESITEEKNFTIPVVREELVIEKKVLDLATHESKDIPKEAVRILLSEEQVEFTKHRVALEDVSIYKQQIVDVKHIEETLKREEAKIKILGSPKVIDELN